MKTRISLAGLLLALALLPLPASATSVKAPAFNSLTAQAEYVVRAVVKSVNPEWRTTADGRRYIASKVELDVQEVLKGTPPSPLVLELVGGRIGDDELLITGAPKFLVGEESVLFVHGNGRLASPLVAVMHGFYPVVRDAGSGQATVLRSNGMPLYSEQDVSLPLGRLSTVKQQNPEAQPLTLANFSRLIRDSANQTTSPTREK